MADETAVDLIQPAKDLQAQKEKESDYALAASGNQKKSSPGGFLSNQFAGVTGANTLKSLKGNPIINMGLDTVNQAVGGMTQSLVGGLTKELNTALSPLQTAVNGFFSALASVTTFGVEIGMELARNAGRSLLKALDEKDRIISDLNIELTALFNACSILANSQPYLNGYLSQLIEAYYALIAARNDFSTVSRVLVTAHRYQKRTFDSGLSNLAAAKDLMLPDKSAIVDIRNTGDFISNTVSRATNKEAIAAALSIPGISFKIGKLLIRYSAKTIEINNLIGNFMGALDDFISAYKRNDSLDVAVSKHINSGVTQIDKILNEMELLIFPTPELQSSLTYGIQLTTSGSFWGLKVSTVEEWMKLAPTKALEQLEATGESLRRYKAAIASLKAISDIVYPGGKNAVVAAQEDGFRTLDVFSKVLVRANTVVARSVSISDIRADFSKARYHVDALGQTSAQIRDAITPFVRTPSSAVGGAKKLIGSIMGAANSLGLDRIASLVNIGAVGKLFGSNASTATFAGNMVTGLNIVIKKSAANPNTNQQDLEKVTDIRDTMERERITKSLEASRASRTTADATSTKEKAKLQKFKDQVKIAEEAARRVDATAASTPDLQNKTEKRVTTLVPNFGANSSS